MRAFGVLGILPFLPFRSGRFAESMDNLVAGSLICCLLWNLSVFLVPPVLYATVVQMYVG